MPSVILIIIGFSVLVLIHELGHFLAARWFGLRIEEFGIGFPPRLLKKKVKDTIYSINAVPLGGFVKIYGENYGIGGNIRQPEKSFAYQPIWKRGIIIAAGVVMNFILGWLLFSAVFFIGSPKLIIISEVAAGSPAAQAGLMPGDQVLGFETINQLVDYINANKGKFIFLAVKRDNKKITVSAVPRLNPPPQEGALGIVLKEAGIAKQGFIASIWQGLIMSVSVIAAIFAGLYKIVLVPQQIIGPVGIFNLALETGQLGLVYLLQFMALISLNLAVLNILPIPVLDGGRLLFLLIEKIRGKRILLETEMKANAAGFAFLIALVVFITIKDIITLF